LSTGSKKAPLWDAGQTSIHNKEITLDFFAFTQISQGLSH